MIETVSQNHDAESEDHHEQCKPGNTASEALNDRGGNPCAARRFGVLI
jgi:hypothetical protein